ncbi:unnamed protein product [Closterium sp. NIES-65]|nr:unnamed protein product [Closterium sp. NIES-65]
MASAPLAFDAVMAETGGPIPSVSDLLSDDSHQSPLAKKVCTGEVSSSAQPVPVQPSEPDGGLDDITLNAADTSSAPLPMLNGPHQRLRRNRGIVGVVVDSLTRDTLNLVTIIFPDSLTESHRSKIVNRVWLGLRPAQFPHSGRVPNFESLAGEILRLPRCSYTRHIFQLPTRDDASKAARADLRSPGNQGRPRIIYIGLGDDIETWTCTLCDWRNSAFGLQS